MIKDRKKQTTFYIGIALIAISFITCVVSFYFVVFGMPMFSVGAILVLLSNQKIRTKLLAILIPLILYVPSALLFLYIYNYSTPKTILIPQDYYGALRIVYEEKCGINYGEIDGVKILAFPENGILILNEDFDRHINYNYYLVDKLGNRTKIPQVIAFRDKSPKWPYVLVSGSGSIGYATDINSEKEEEREIKYADFYVYNSRIEGNEDDAQQKMDSLTLAVVNRCRQQ